MKRSAAAALLIAVCSLAAVCGCARREAAPIVSGTQPNATLGAGRGGQEEIQSMKESQLVLLFRGLLLMDMRPELSIQKQQSEKLLPIVRDSVQSGSMSPAQRKMILDLLTKEQNAFIADGVKNLRRPAPGADRVTDEAVNDPAAGTKRQTLEDMRQKQAGSDLRPAPPHPRFGPSAAWEDDWSSREKSVEQQLIDLLESKLK